MYKKPTFRHISKGFTLIELLVVIVIIGVLAVIAAQSMRGATTDGTAQQLYNFVSSAANNWRLINQKCGTGTDVSNSTVVASPSVTNSLALVISGNSYLNTTHTGCYNNSNVVPLVGKATGNPTDGFTVAGYTVTWSGGSAGTPISFVINGVLVDVALKLYNQYSSATGARNAVALPASGDTTDPVFRFSAPAGGLTTITFRVF